jgi:hypothetical protein
MDAPNPTAVILLLVAIVLVIIAVKGTQDNWITAVLGHQPSWDQGATVGPSQGATALLSQGVTTGVGPLGVATPANPNGAAGLLGNGLNGTPAQGAGYTTSGVPVFTGILGAS